MLVKTSTLSSSADLVRRPEVATGPSALCCHFCYRKLLGGFPTFPQLGPQAAPAPPEGRGPEELQPLHAFSLLFSPPFPGCQRPRGGAGVTNGLRALCNHGTMYGVHGAGEDRCVLDVGLSAQTRKPQPPRLTPCTPVAC